MTPIYLDHNATTQLDAGVLEAMLPYLQEKFGNPSSIHRWGRPAKVAVQKARQQVAGLIGASPQEIFFTGGGSEADSWALQAIALGTAPDGGLHQGKQIITSQIEHPAVLKTCKYLEEQGTQVTYLPVDGSGRVSPQELEAAITEQTILVSIMYGNNEVGTLQPIAEIGQILQGKGIYFHCDAVQAAGKLPLSVKGLGLDLLSLSAHKMYCPKGVGALYVKAGTPIKPLIYGGGQEQEQRAGTENVAGIVGFGQACQLAQEELPQRQAKLEALTQRLYEQIQTEITGVQLNGHPQLRLPGTLNLSFARISGEDLLLNLDLEGIAVSTGAACKAGAHQPSYILQAMGVSQDMLQGTIRISLGKDNTEEELQQFVSVLKPIVKRLRAGLSCR